MSGLIRWLEGLAARVERDAVLALIGGTFLLPFSLHHLVQGRLLLGGVTTGLALWFLGHGLAVHFGRRIVPAWVIFVPALGVLGFAMRQQAELGLFWCYPAMLLFHFVLGRNAANLFNVTVVGMAVPFAWAAFGPPIALRVGATLLLTILFANVFSFLAERQQRRAAAQERELEIERDRLGLLVHATKAGFTDWDAVTNDVIYSERFKEMLGYPPDADTKDWPNFFDRMHPDDRERVQQEFRAMLRQERAPGLQQPGQSLDYRLRRADGGYVWVHAESLVQVDQSLRVRRFITSFQDIGKFREQEATMREQHKFIGDVLDSLPIGLTMRDLDGRYVFVNRAWEAFTGAKRAEVIGKTVHERAPKDEADRVVQGDREMFARGPDAPPTLQDMLHNGRRYILSRTVMTGAGGEVRGVLVASVDTTERWAIEQALANEQKRLELVVRAGNVGFLDWDGAGKTAYYSPRFKQILGYPADADTSEWPDYFHMIHPEDRGRVQARFRRHIFEEGEEHETMHYRLRKADGSHVWVEAVGLSVRDERGFATRFIASIRDISERRAAEEARLTEQRRLDLVVQAAQVGIVDWDGRTKKAFYSPRFRAMLGFSPEDGDDWDYFQLIHPEDRERVAARWREFITGRGPEGPHAEHYASHQYRVRRADGGLAWVQASGVAVRDEAGRVLRWIAAVTDVTEQRQEEERRLTEQRRLDLVVSAAQVGIVDWDGRTHATFYSPRFREMLGYAPDADTSQWPDYFKAMIHPDDRARITRRWQAFIFGKGPEGPQGTFYSPEQYRLQRADGSHIWIQASGIAVRDEKGFVTRWIAAVTDITAQREQEEALRESVRLREEVERMSRHDLKTPLNSIIAVPRLIREGRKLSSEEHQLLNIVERAGYRILNLVNLSLDLFRMEQGRYAFRPQAVDVVDLVAKVIGDLESQAASKSVAIEVKKKADQVLARAEELLCYPMLANLIKNAIEASPEGGTVTVTIQSGLGALVHIHNPGAVPESVRERFFEKYSTAGKPEGVGLGTYSALLMARVQEGNVTMRTSEAEGTTVTVQLAEAPADAVPVTASESAQRAPARMPALAPLEVLVVDDDEFNRLVMKRYLPTPPLGKVVMAVNGRAAIEALKKQHYDYVFLDLEMPVMSGYEAAMLIRLLEKAEKRKPSVVVAFSSNDDETSIKRALAAGCDHYLTKPAPRETLWKILAGSAPDKLAKAAGAPSAGPADPVDVDADLRPTLPAFFLSRRETLADIAASLEKDDRAGARRLAHKLAGSFSLYGFKWAADQCRQLERGAPATDLPELQQRIEAVRAHLDSVQLRFVEGAQA
jgi:PAS domain S-box-containing protein